MSFTETVPPSGPDLQTDPSLGVLGLELPGKRVLEVGLAVEDGPPHCQPSNRADEIERHPWRLRLDQKHADDGGDHAHAELLRPAH
jgi:hypothetical protein